MMKLVARLMIAALVLIVPTVARAITISGWKVIDDGAGPGLDGNFSAVGFGDRMSLAFDSNHDILTTGARGLNDGQNPSNVATWTFLNLPAGLYDIAISISDNSNRATNAPYRINGGSPILVNQQLTATGSPILNFVFDGNIPFQILASAYPWGGGDLVVTLTDDANGRVVADAVALQAVPEPASGVLLLMGALTVGAFARRRK